MEIIIDKARKDLVLLKKDGTEISRYSYKNVLADNFTEDDLKKDIDGFNKTLAMQEEFDDIKKLAEYNKIHNWG